jgi:hypothetical protein
MGVLLYFVTVSACNSVCLAKQEAALGEDNGLAVWSQISIVSDRLSATHVLLQARQCQILPAWTCVSDVMMQISISVTPSQSNATGNGADGAAARNGQRLPLHAVRINHPLQSKHCLNAQIVAQPVSSNHQFPSNTASSWPSTVCTVMWYSLVSLLLV